MTPLKKLNDDELLDQLRSGDQAAFTALYNRHWQFLYTACYNALRHKEDSMDVCQAVFLWVWENHQLIQVQTTLKGYLYTAVKYKIANLIRSGRVREILLDDWLTADIRTQEIHELEIKELKSFIAQLINELPEKCREVFIMSRELHLSHKEIAEQLNISEKTVDDHITRALKKLRIPLNKMASLFLTL